MSSPISLAAKVGWGSLPPCEGGGGGEELFPFRLSNPEEQETRGLELWALFGAENDTIGDYDERRTDGLTQTRRGKSS